MNHKANFSNKRDSVDLSKTIDDAVDNTEEPEGVDSSDELEMHDYPLDSLLIRSEPRSVHEVCRRIGQNLYIMDPDFQRDFIWESEKQSRLIESLLMRIPLPVFYLAERKDGKVIVIDGLQRLTTIYNFLTNAFGLRHLDKANAPFYGKYFKDLPLKLQTRLEDTQLIIYILDEKVPERARLDIFERVNGGTPLSRQQMRNCMYCGPATKMLEVLSREMIFFKATGRSLSWKTMRDREFINRFMAFHILGVDAYRGDMDLFLAEVLEKINTFSPTQIENLKKIFMSSMDRCFVIWGEHCFRKQFRGQERRNVINAALFDVLSTKMAVYQKSLKKLNIEQMREALLTLFENQQFNQSISYSTNSLRQVAMRFKMLDDAFEGI